MSANPPETAPTDISLSQFLAIQEKGVSAWEFEPELEIANCFVEARTEIEFFDSECSVQSNLPIPKQNEVYYWEAKVYDRPETTTISVGLTTKPYPLFRMPGKTTLLQKVASTNSIRISQDVYSISLERTATLQPALHGHPLWPRICARRCDWCWLSTTYRQHLLHTKRQEVGRGCP